jgi:hypothetical protein
MGFSKAIKSEILVLCARHCCVCHKPKGLNIEVHHIVPQEQGGADALDNAIALCFDCHADAGHYFAGHPKGVKLSPDELQKHKAAWIAIVAKNGITEPKSVFAELTLKDKDTCVFKPEFLEETTSYENRSFWKDMFAPLNMDFMEYFEKTRNDNASIFKDPHYDAIKTYDDYIDWLNGKHITMKEPKPYTGCQPYILNFNRHLQEERTYYKSNIELHLRFTNYGPEVLEDYKLYLHFENVVDVDSVNKRQSILDQHKYSYNVHFVENTTMEFLPERLVLVQNDSVILDQICFKADPKAKIVNIRWELFARNIQVTGTLSLKMTPKIEKRHTSRYVDNAEGMKDEIVIRPQLYFDCK